MESQPSEDKKPQTQDILLKADEVDAGTTIRSPGGTRPLSALTSTDINAGTARPKPPPRPILRREGSAPPPPPPSQPPPAPPPSQPEDPTDSLSLPQLRQLVRHFPKVEPKAFAYQYQDGQDFATEIDEWFHYTKADQERDYLLAAREAYEEIWHAYTALIDQKEATWLSVSQDQQAAFLSRLRTQLLHDEITERQRAIAALLYILSGVWTTTAGADKPSSDQSDANKTTGNALQIDWMHKNVDLFVEEGLLQPLFNCMRRGLERPLDKAKQNTEDSFEGVFDDDQFCKVSLCFSCFYIMIESARSRILSSAGKKIRDSLLLLEPNFLVFITHTISRLRWDEYYNIPLMHAVQLLWKTILLVFGDTKEHLEKIKSILQPRVDPFSVDACKPILTASPLDYHLFRQEITSKYPAYNPPLPLIPLETDQRTILPPLPHHAARADAFDAFHRSAQPSGSIMHQPVHIATPAPSPPPSPGGPGGKGGKKQNYQTNQNFPFLYPPLDSNSNKIGGKGSTEHQDSTVGKTWEGSDVPASILEAGELFASRMRMTRAMQQLWKERDLFMKYDRGWDGERDQGKDQSKLNEKQDPTQDKLQDPELQSRMDSVEEYFHAALPDLQSLIIVMMKVMLTNVQDIAVRNNQLQEAQNQGGLNRSKSSNNLNNAPNTIPTPPSPPRPNEISVEDLDNIRSREISQKAISACLFLMLKWFKISHVLKFEYITQLMLDSNYIQLTLKYFAHQNLEELVSFRYDRDDLSFWRYCQLHSDHPPLSPTSPTQHSDHEGEEDDAAPPPIQRHRRSPTSTSDGNQQPQTPQDHQQQTYATSTTFSPQPLVDELGNPLTEFPSSPISATDYSTRHFHTSISLLRIMQKVTRSKAHRILLLVSFKSAQILRRILRVPEPMLRLYVLKLFKSQVPYCGRKWRQSNMRVITAIYLHCRPELRDDWLAGLHDAAPGAGMGGPGANVDAGAEYEEAVPLEWGLRGLTFWWMKRRYGDVMKAKALQNKKEGTNGEDTEMAPDERAGQEIDDEERDFFKRELDAVGWGLAEMGFKGDGEEVGFGEEAPGATGEINGVDGTQSTVPGQVGQDFGPHSNQWAAASPNSEFGPLGVAQGGGNMMGGATNIPATDITDSFLRLFGAQNLTTAAELGILDLGAASERRATHSYALNYEPPQQRQPSPRRRVSAPAAIEYAHYPDYSEFRPVLTDLVSSKTAHQHPVSREQLSGLFGDEYDEDLDDDDGGGYDEDDMEGYLIDIGTRRRSTG
ncbi:Factor arrest protein 11 [Knufia obscura]|uniref:Factor arrest protein 11 n=1 Tax=Knufia obscura TaxID=1635080 RepID=A0ABR0RD41_9EURO|nr:Factor arrest protein 11 [Knufia obscura]